MNVWPPTFLVSIGGQKLTSDITQDIISFVFEDNEEEADLLELTVANRYGQFTDDPMFQEGNVVEAKWGYVGNMSPLKKCVIKEISYDFPVGVPTIKLKAYDKGVVIAQDDVQKNWTAAPPGLTASQIAEKIAAKHGLKPVIEPSAGPLVKVAQANESDMKFLARLAKEARPASGKECAGYSFFIEGDELHFHPADYGQAPSQSFEYFGKSENVLISFQPETLSQTSDAGASGVKAKGVDPRSKAPTEQAAGNTETPDRAVMGDLHWDLASGAETQEAAKPDKGKIAVDATASATRHEEPSRPAGKDQADAAFKKGEAGQLKATAQTIGIPSLRAKRTIEITGVGRKFSGAYYVTSVRHQIDGSGYLCELKLKRNAVGKTASDKAAKPTGGQKNDQAADPKKEEAAKLVTIDLETGAEGTA